jgi:prolyl-tRNA synthetase
LFCPSCGYAANVEKAESKPDFSLIPPEEKKAAVAKLPAIELIDTPETKTIEELCVFLKTDSKKFIKTLIYRALNVESDLNGWSNLVRHKASADAPEVFKEVFVAVCIRGDLAVNETKLAGILKASEVMLACDNDVERITNAPVGFAGPVGLKTVPVLADKTVTAMTDAVCGALIKDKHYKNVCFGRDFEPLLVCDLRTVVAGDCCPVCGAVLYEKKGNELGHIFKLGYKYTKTMHVNYLDADGKAQTPIMGCYGIGLDRALASVIEEHHDDAGIIWPVSIAPFHVVLVPIKYDGIVKEKTDLLESELTKSGIEVLVDDRSERAGVKFNDADLIGFPWRVVLGEKNLALNPPKVEIKDRREKEPSLVDFADAVNILSSAIQKEI